MSRPLPSWYLQAIEVALQNPGQCSTAYVGRAEPVPGELSMCPDQPVLDVLVGCVGERLYWRRKCELCLGRLRAGLQFCIQCPERHVAYALQIRRDEVTR